MGMRLLKSARLLTVLAMALAALVAISACGSKKESTAKTSAGATTTASSDKPVVMGFVGAQTGFMSTYDQPVLIGMKAAVNKINADGGVLGGRQIKFIECDSKTDPAQAGVCAKQVIEQGADFVLPACDFDYGAPAARVANDAGVISIGCAGSPQFGAQGIGPLVFNTSAGANTEGAIMAEWAYEKKGWRKPYIISDVSLEYTKINADSFAKRWTELAGASSIAGKNTFDNKDASAAGQVSRLQQAAGKADFIVLASYPPGGASLVRQIRAAGIKLPIIGSAAFDGTYWLKSVPNLSEFYFPALGSLFGDDPDPARAKLLDVTYKEIAGKMPALSSYPLQGYAAMQTLAVGMEKAGTTTGKEMAAKLDTLTDVPMITGPLTYTPNCHIPIGRPYLLMQIQNGKGSYTGTTWKPKQVPEQIC